MKWFSCFVKNLYKKKKLFNYYSTIVISHEMQSMFVFEEKNKKIVNISKYLFN